MIFNVKITMGNDAMLNGYDIARALRSIADDVEEIVEETGVTGEMQGKVMDLNGNSVGEWSMED